MKPTDFAQAPETNKLAHSGVVPHRSQVYASGPDLTFNEPIYNCLEMEAAGT